jgi:outer membrane protein TolC
MRLSRLAVIVLILLNALATIARAEPEAPYVPPEFLTSSPTLPPTYDGAAVWRIDLGEAITIAMKHNLGISLARQTVEQSRLGVAAAKASLYEPTLSAGYSHGSSTTPPPTAQAGPPGSQISSASDAWSVSLGQRLPTGADLTVSTTGGRSASSSGTAVYPLDYTSSVSFGIHQPLLRGFSLDLAIPQLSILTAQISSQTARLGFEVTAAALVQTTEAAYWDLVAALYQYDLAVKAHKVAEDMVVLTRRQIAAGLLPGSNLTAAESELARNRLAVLSAEATIASSSDALRTALALPRDQWSRPLLPTDKPRYEPAVVTSQGDALAAAIQHRPELAQAELALRSSVLAMRKADNDRLPDLGIGLTTTVYGQDPSYGGVVSGLGRRDNTGWTAMVNLSWAPLGQASRIAAKAARIQHESTVIARQQLVQDLWSAVRGAIRQQQAAALQLTAASQARVLARQALDNENRKYLSGDSTTTAIAELQKRVAEAEVAELGQLLAHQRAATALLMTTGRLLEARHIQVTVTAP